MSKRYQTNRDLMEDIYLDEILSELKTTYCKHWRYCDKPNNCKEDPFFEWQLEEKMMGLCPFFEPNNKDIEISEVNL